VLHPRQVRLYPDHARDPLGERRQDLGVAAAVHDAGEDDLALPDVDADAAIVEPERAPDDLLPDLAGDLLVAAGERAHEGGGGTDPNELAVLHDREAVDALLDHQLRRDADGAPRLDRQRRGSHRLAHDARIELQPVDDLERVDQPRERAATARLAPALLDEQVGLRDDAEHAPVGVDHGQPRDAV